MKILTVVNTKGGVGKSTVSYNILPLVHDNVKIFEIDSSNNSKLEKSEIQADNFTIEKIDCAIDEIDFAFLTEAAHQERKKDKEFVIILDIGAGNDTVEFIRQIRHEEFRKNMKFFIPTNDDYEQFKNIQDTIELLKTVDPKIKVNLVLNRVFDRNKVKEQFVNLFGSETFGIANRIDQLQNHIDKMYIVENTPIFGILKAQYQRYLKDILPAVEELLNNQAKFKKKWAEEGREAFTKGRRKIDFFKKVNELGKVLKKEFK